MLPVCRSAKSRLKRRRLPLRHMHMERDREDIRMENADFKSGFVTLIGRPNVGKSTLMNHLIGQKIAITSSKPQTTRNRIQTVYTSKEGQIVFLDTPGIHKAKNKLGEYMEAAAEQTLKEVDVILWLVEPTDHIGKGELAIAGMLKNVHQPVILIMNKMDTVNKNDIPGYLDAYRELYDFADMIPVCALRGLRMEEVIRAIFRYLPCGPKFYDDDTVTDQPQRQIVAELIREKALRCLEEEIPHGIAVTIEYMRERPAGSQKRKEGRAEAVRAKSRHRHEHPEKGSTELNAQPQNTRDGTHPAPQPGNAGGGTYPNPQLKNAGGGTHPGSQSKNAADGTGSNVRQRPARDTAYRDDGTQNLPLGRRAQAEVYLRETADWIMDIEATIICEKDSHKGMIIGKQGAMLRRIGSQARYEIEQMLEEPVNLQLWVKVKKDWRDSDFLIKNFGYDKKELNG